MLTLDTGAPQGCVLSPLLYPHLTNDCIAPHDSNTMKFADDTMVLGNESAYSEEVRELAVLPGQ